MKRTLLFFLLMGVSWLQAQVTFESSIPVGWTTSGAYSLSLSGSHYKGGTSSLKWDASPNQVLTVSGLNVHTSVIASTVSGTAHFWLYAETVSNDTLVVEFLDALDVVQRTGRVLLDFKGWRDYHRNYAVDYGTPLPATFNLRKVRFILKRSGTGSRPIWIDEVRWSGDLKERFPGPHMRLDVDQFADVYGIAGGRPLQSWLNSPDIATSTPSGFELSGITTVKSRTARVLVALGGGELSAADAFLTGCSITETGGQVLGRGLQDIHDQDVLVSLAGYCNTFGRSFLVDHNATSKQKLALFTRYLLDQGMAEGGRNCINTNDYANARDFSQRFLDIMEAYDEPLKSEVVRMLKWSNEYNKIYNSGFIVRNNADFVHTKITHLYRLAVLGTDNSEVARDLKSLRRFLAISLQARDGAQGWLKPDGLGFHHRSKYAHYMYAYGTWIDAANYVRGTPYRMTRDAYHTMVGAMKTLLLESNRGKTRSSGTSGRFPFPDALPVDSNDFRRLIAVGTDSLPSTEPVGASLFNYFYGVQRYSGVPQVNLDGYHQFNYGQMGVQRTSKWVAVSRGLTDKMFGSEIYVDANRYGRYQSYGALEILYDGLPATGYLKYGPGWDWNVMPGTTTVHLPYASLNPNRDVASEYQGKSFAGALSAGNAGIFAIDFEQSPGVNYYTSNQLTFRKSVFAFDTLLVCLGSKINGTGGEVATNIFQSINTSTNPAIYVNSATPLTADIDTSLPTGQSNWMVNAQTTGFYLPQGNQQLKLLRGEQTSPQHSSKNGALTATAKASKAWIAHGTTPVNAKYEYVVVPSTTPAAMQVLVDSLDLAKVYQVVAHNDSCHAIRYLPAKTNAYAFFKSAQNVNLGLIKGVSANCLMTLRELGDTLVLRIVNPDLNTVVAADPAVEWQSMPFSISVQLSERWRFLQSSSPGTSNTTSSTNYANHIQLDFVLHQGNCTEVKLVRDQTQMGIGVWAFAEETWFYDLAAPTLAGDTVFSSVGTLRSVSEVGAPGFLPNPPLATKARVSLGSSGNGSYHRIGTGATRKILIHANATALNKLSVYGVGNQPVTSIFFTLGFGSQGTNGNWVIGIGDHGTAAVITDNAYPSSTSYTSGLFTVLRFDLGTTNIAFKYRKKVSDTSVSYVQIDQSTFTKGGDHFVEFYGNNAVDNNSYLRQGNSYVVPAGTFHLWVNGNRIAVPVEGYDIPASEADPGSPIAAFFVASTGNKLPSYNSATLSLADMQARFAPTILPLELMAFGGALDKSGAGVHLDWKVDRGQQLDHFNVLRQTANMPQWKKLGRVDAISGRNTYAFADHSLPVDTHGLSYRLQLVDRNGGGQLSVPLAIKLPNGNGSQLKVYPNPSDGMATASCYAPVAKLAVLRIADISGRIHLERKVSLVRGHQEFELDFSSFVPGLYFVQLDGQVVKLIRR